MTADLTVLSLGAGKQSTTLGLLAAEGLLPKPDVAIFADTGWEPKAVYDHLAALTVTMEAAGIPVVHVSAGNLRDDALDPDVPGIRMPVFVKSDNTAEKRGAILSRQCTGFYKLDPINREIRARLGATIMTNECRYCSGTGTRIVPSTSRPGTCSVCRGTGQVVRVGRAPAGKVADVWIGISTDEVGRAAPTRVPYTRAVHPLLDLGMSRDDCDRFNRSRGWTTVVKSACIGCPFHGNRAWRELRDEHPDEWADAVDFDRGLREMPGSANRRGAQAFLHSSGLPLDQAPIDRVTRSEWADRRTDIFDFIEDGDPDGCGPFTCRSGLPVEPSEEAS